MRQFSEGIKNNRKALHESIQRSVQPLAQAYQQVASRWQTIIQDALKFQEEYGKVMVAGLKNFKPPEEYVATAFALDARFKQIVMDEVDLINDQFKASRFGFLADRLDAGREAHKRDDYHAALLLSLSVTDGILRDFFLAHNDIYVYREKFPSFSDLFEHFIQHYKGNELFVPTEEFDKLLQDFFEHRNEIVHGGHKAFFDENLTVISFGFLVLIFETVVPFFEKGTN